MFWTSNYCITLSPAGRAVVFHHVNLTAAFSSYSSNGTAEGLSSFGLGYRGMCRSASVLRAQLEAMRHRPPGRAVSCGNSARRMMSGPVFLLPPMMHIDRFFVRLDADSHITRPVTKRSDPLATAAEGGHMYVFWSVALETCRCASVHFLAWDFNLHFILRWLGHNCSHMHDIARAHLLAAGTNFEPEMYSMFRRQVCNVSRKCVLPLLTVCSLQVPSDDVMRGLYFQTNFEIVHMKFARSHAFQGMFNAFDCSEVMTFAISVMFASAFGRTCWPFE